MQTSGHSLYREKYDLVFSIGAACSCSSLLRNCCLQFRSFPFDWLYGATLEERARMFVNEFRDWLPINAMECIGEQKIEDIPKLVYKNSITGIVFNHDFPLNQSFEQSYPVVKARYNRRISRLLEMIRSSKRVLIVHLSTPDATQDYTDEYLINVQKIISDCFPKVSIHLLHFYNIDNKAPEKNKIESPAQGIFTARFCYNAFNTKFPYHVNEQPLRKILLGIQMSSKQLTLWDSLNRWSSRHPFLNHFLRFKVKSSNKQIVEIFRIRICSFQLHQ